MQPEFFSREKLLSYFKRQQNEKPTPNCPICIYNSDTLENLIDTVHRLQNQST